MALLYRADLTPGKLDHLAGWLPARPWYRGPAAPALERVAACRFDDPDGEVGLETIVVRAEPDGPLFHTPLTYRAAPLDGADDFLLGTSEHSVLGTRWIYDAAGDPVYADAVATTILTGGTEAAEHISTDGGLVPRAPLMSVRGTGAPGAPRPAAMPAIALVRVLGGDRPEGPALLWGDEALVVIRDI